MKYKIIDMDKAPEIAREKLAGKTGSFAEHEREIGTGSPLSETVLTSIATDIRKHMKAIEKRGEDREDLDALAFDIIHKKLPPDPDMLGDGRFWARFALVFLFDVVVWRFPGKGAAGFNIENLGIGKSVRRQAENYLYKLWVRGELCRIEKAKDPYQLGRLGSIDFWTSHIHRQSFSNCRNVALEIIRFQYPPKLKGRPYLLPSVEDVAAKKRGIRTLVKRVRRVWATVEYTLLESNEIQELLKDLSKGLTVANG